jgi:hypothetical protein
MEIIRGAEIRLAVALANVEGDDGGAHSREIQAQIFSEVRAVSAGSIATSTLLQQIERSGDCAAALKE